MYRRRPSITRACYAGCIITLLVLAIYARSVEGLSLVCLIMAVAIGVALALSRTEILIANQDGITHIWQRLLGPRGGFDHFPSAEVRRVRYRSEEIPDTDKESYKIIYYLDLVTQDSRIVLLLKTEYFSFDVKLGRKLAQAAGVPYEEQHWPER